MKRKKTRKIYWAPCSEGPCVLCGKKHDFFGFNAWHQKEAGLLHKMKQQRGLSPLCYSCNYMLMEKPCISIGPNSIN